MELTVVRPGRARRLDLPRAAWLVVAASAAAGIAALAWRAAAVTGWEVRDLLGAAAIASLAALAEQFPITIRLRTEAEEVLLTDVVFAAALLLAPPSVLTVGAAAGLIAGQVPKGRAWPKLAFNVGHELLGLMLAEIVFGALLHPVGAPAAAAVGLAAYLAVNEVSLAGILWLAEGQAFLRVLGRPIGLSLMQWAGNLSLGIVGAEVWMRVPALTPLLAVPVGLTYLAYRGWFRSSQEERAKAAFVATVSHELRTPLTPLKGFLTMMAQGQLDPSEEERREYFGIMAKQANRLERLISDLLDVTTLDAGAPAVDATDVDLRAVVDERVAEFRAEVPGRDIRIRCPDPAPWVLADRVRVGQIVSNLLSNALKFSPQDAAVEVVVERDAVHATVSVADRGPGIPAEEQELVFERFHRVDDSDTRAAGGAGLGLYIAKRFTEAMGGRIWLRSDVGRGSTFSFSLPLGSDVVVVPDEDRAPAVSR